MKYENITGRRILLKAGDEVRDLKCSNKHCHKWQLTSQILGGRPSDFPELEHRRPIKRNRPTKTNSASLQASRPASVAPQVGRNLA